MLTMFKVGINGWLMMTFQYVYVLLPRVVYTDQGYVIWMPSNLEDK